MSIFIIITAFAASIILLAAFTFLPMALFEKENQSEYPEYHKSNDR